MKDGIPLAGVIGWPINHSRSPVLHGYWLERYGITGYYVPVAVAPENLREALGSLSLLGFRGVNVTIPHKEAVLELAKTVSETAKAIGAANTITFLEGGGFHADNTDAYGFRENIRQTHPDWRADRGPALVIGAGGASRAVIQTLIDEGTPEIRLANRTRQRAEALSEHFGGPVKPVDWSKLEDATDSAVTVVNTTALGMAGQEPLEVNLMRADPEAIVSDIVYVPLETPFLKKASSQGFRTVDGLGMLLHQGVPGFQAWFGKMPVVDADLRARVLG
ncbi:shikimate dehydrogenase [Amaricoccus macauensis]|uniref:shikimate dehydrogenase n=1 Tax=Amaricoccus macauensis TaxID=57001 RepID=UPI003C7B386B